jgi:putative ABC transport system permease protein
MDRGPSGWVLAVRDSVRTWRRSPGVALVAVLSLGLGIGATSAAFSVVERVLLRRLAVPQPEQLFKLATPGAPGVNVLAWQQLQERRHLFASAYAWTFGSLNLAPAGAADLVSARFASASVFETLRIAPHLGRFFDTRDDVRGGGPDGHVVVISHAFWLGRFGGDPQVIGRPLTIEREAFTIIGVLPPSLPGLTVGDQLDLLIPLGSEPAVNDLMSVVDSKYRQTLRVILRLSEDSPVDAVISALRADQEAIRAASIPSRAPQQVLDRYLKEPFNVESAANGGSDVRYYGVAASIALGLAVLVLLAACGNVATVLLAHGATRTRELSVRAALGASPWDGVRQRFADSAVLAGAGVVLGLAMARAGSGWLTAQLATLDMGSFASVNVDWRAAAVGVGAGVMTALVCGLGPAVSALRVQPADTLKAAGPRHTGGEGSQRVIIAAQLALSVVIILVGALLFRGYSRSASMVGALRPEGALVADLRFWRSELDASARETALDEIQRGVSSLPGVAVAAGNGIPLVGGAYYWPLDVPGDADPDQVAVNSVGRGYFDVVGAVRLAGRTFTTADVAGAPMVGVVTRTFARRYLGGESRVPQTVARIDRDTRQAIEIVGVVDDLPTYSFLEPPEPQLFVVRAQDTPENFNTMMLVRAPAGTSAATIGEAISRAAPAVSFTLNPYGGFLWSEFTRERFLTAIAVFFVGLAALLAGVGVFGVLSYSVATRQRELGVRVALGARAGQIRGLVFRRAGTLILAGGGLGLLASVGVGRVVAARLNGVPAGDLQSMAAVSAFVAVIGALAAWWPARRAARVDPIVVLRDE